MIGSRQDQTREEWQVKIRTTLGTVRTEYRLTEEAAEALRDRYDVIEITKVHRTLDF